MKHMKGIATWVTAFIFAVALIVVYKTFDNFSAIWSFVSRLMDIISPFVFGFGLAFLLYAPCSKFESLFKRTQKRFVTKHARGISIAIVYVLLLLLLSLLFSFALPAAFRGIMNFVSQLPGYLDTAYQTVMDFVDRFGQNSGWISSADVHEKLMEIQNKLIESVKGITPEMLFGYMQNILSFTSSLFNVLLGFIISVYMLASREALVRSVKSICSLFMKEKWIAMCSEYSHKISKIFYSYFYSTLLDACLIGIIVSIGLWIIGVPNALLLGMMVGLMNIIPYFGAIIGGVICVIIAFLSGNIYSALLTGIYIIVMQQLDGNFIQPRIVGSSVGVRPIYVLLAVTVGGGLFGFWGTLLGVPFMAIVQMLLHDLIAYRNARKQNRFAAAEEPAEDTPAEEPPQTEE